MNKVEIADRLQTCFSSVVHDVMRDEGLQSFTLPSSITPTKENYNDRCSKKNNANQQNTQPNKQTAL